MTRLDEIRVRAEAATPGPWMWDMRTGCKLAQIVTTHSGMYYVMQFARWGMSDKRMNFQTIPYNPLLTSSRLRDVRPPHAVLASRKTKDTAKKR